MAAVAESGERFVELLFTNSSITCLFSKGTCDLIQAPPDSPVRSINPILYLKKNKGRGQWPLTQRQSQGEAELGVSPSFFFIREPVLPAAAAWTADGDSK